MVWPDCPSAPAVVALTLLRGWIPAAYLPEARRKVAALPDDGLPLLPAPKKPRFLSFSPCQIRQNRV